MKQTTRILMHHSLYGFDVDVVPVVGLGLGLTAITLGIRPRFAPIPLTLTALATLFYRDPERPAPTNPTLIYAPADGIVQHIDDMYEHRYLHTDSIRISTLTSLFHVPVSRSPTAGTIRYLEYIPGNASPLRFKEASEHNSCLHIGIETAWGPLLVTQMIGPLTQRVVGYVEPDTTIRAGQRISTIRFGSRTDVIIQRDSLTMLVEVGQKLQAGVTPLASIVSLSGSFGTHTCSGHDIQEQT